MPAIITDKYRGFLAQQFLDGLLANSAAAYCFVGHPSPWVDSGNVAVSDTNPPVPIDNPQTTDFDYWRDMVGAKVISGANSQFVVARNDWLSGTIYDQYDDQDTHLSTREFFVLDTTSTPLRVYKCVWNNNGGTSTTAPSVIGAALVPTTTADGYVWQYMYTIGSENKKFLTQLWMPVLSDNSVQTNATTNAGKLPTSVPLKITEPGAGYNAAAAVTTTLVGDGSGASVTANGVVVTGGAVSRITLATGGLGYSHVTSINVFQTGASVQAAARAIIPPYPNHGFDPVTELCARALMLTAQFESDEGGKLATDNDYRRVGLLINPVETGGNLASAAFYKQTTDITISANTGAFNPDDVIVNQTKPSSPFATVVDVTQDGNAHYVVRVTSLEKQGEAVPFEFDDVFKCLASGAEGTVNAVNGPELLPFSGNIVFINQRTPVARAADQIEEMKLIFPF